MTTNTAPTRRIRRASPAPKARIDRLSTFQRERFLTFIRWIILAACLIFFPWLGGWLFEPRTPVEEPSYMQVVGPQDAEVIYDPFRLPPIFNNNSLRYVIAPLAAVVIVILSGASFVQDVFEIKKFRPALHYVVASTFAIIGSIYPKLTIDGGEKKIAKGEINPLDKIGGPGYVIIQPGNAVFLKFIDKPSRVEISRSVFLAPFETIGPIINLDDQHGKVDEMSTMTSEGIEVKLTNITFRFRIIYRKSASRSLNDPYPFDRDALRRMGTNLVVNDFGLIPWAERVKQGVQTAVRDYINLHTLDELTAPRDNNADPRRLFREEVMKNVKLWAIGAELLWIDVGHIEIIEENVDEERVKYWVSLWEGNPEAIRQYKEARLAAWKNQEIAAQEAALMREIVEIFNEVTLDSDSKKNQQILFLARVGNMLEQKKNQLSSQVSEQLNSPE